MNKTELKNFAVAARRDLLAKVALRAKIFGIDEKNNLTIEDKFGQIAINGETYSSDKKSAFLSLKKQLETKGYEQLIEEVAYTWFNRIIAIRYMEVNKYLPEQVNVLSSSTGKVEPDILSQFETMELDIDIVKIKDLIYKGETESAFRELFIAQCNALNKILPFMFEKIHDYTELLLPDFLLDSESVIKKLVLNEALTESFSEVEVIGWLYQFYNSEPKDKVFANLKKNKKIEKYDIPAATQLFTPKWIVQYMVENSLGQLWLESNPDSPLKESMQYHIEPAKQEGEVKRELEEIRYENINLEEIKIIDPCVGSGHILVYAFDLMYKMYEEAGYPGGDIPQIILEKNLYGLDIDDRAAQLASFALIMKARERSRRVFRKQIKLNIYAIQESNDLDKEGIAQLIGQTEVEKEEIRLLIETFINAKDFGSIIYPPVINYNNYLKRIEELGEEQLTLENFIAVDQIEHFSLILIQGLLLTHKYDIYVTNPPYMNNKGMNGKLQKFINVNYPKAKSDIFSAFIERSFSLTKKNGFIPLMTPMVWMFNQSYEALREKIINEKAVHSLIHLHYDAFTSASVPICTFILRNNNFNYKGEYIRLTDFYGEDIQPLKVLEAIVNPNIHYRYSISNKDFTGIPTMPIAYWASLRVREIFRENKLIGEIASAKQGLATADNNRFLRFWYEVQSNNIGFQCADVMEAEKDGSKWFPYNKGGKFRKWYGNQSYVVNWKNNGAEIKSFTDDKGKVRSRPQNTNYYFKEGITWTDLTSGGFGARYSPQGFIFDTTGPTMFSNSKNNLLLLLGFTNTNVFQLILDLTMTGFHYNNGVLANLPIWNNIENEEEIIKIISRNIDISKEDWDFSEVSWGFKSNPLFKFKMSDSTLKASFERWKNYLNILFNNLKENEEELNRFFINLFDLQNELTPEVPDKKIIITKADHSREAKSFLSYFIGCLMGRYSLDDEGLIYTGDEWDDSKYKKFKSNKFGLIQITDEHYFKDDIITSLQEFLSVTFGLETVEENLQWLAESLELRRNETAEQRLRRYFLEEFFKDHCQLYQKRPIYWLVESGKENGLRTLIYMHRYQPDTMATIRFEHLQEIQAKYNNEIVAVDLRIVNPNLSATEKLDLEKRKTAYQKRLEELLEFDKKLAEYANSQIAIDLDDGVKVNYEKFDKVLAKIK